MKIRTQRTHFMGVSNRAKQFNTRPADILEKSYLKSQSCYYRSPPEADSVEKYTANDPFIGTHNQFSSSRFDAMNERRPKDTKWVVEALLRPIDKSKRLNEPVGNIRQEFREKQVNMYKLNQLKHTFMKNNVKKRNLKDYFERFAKNGVVGKEEIKAIVKEYGYSITNDEAMLIFKLTSADHHLNQSQFIDLMTKDNVFFRTLKVNPIESNQSCFPEKVHIVLRNKFSTIKEAFAVYRGQAITEEHFHAVMKKLDITDLVLSREERQAVYQMFSKEESFNVERLLGQIAAQERLTRKMQTKESSFEDNLKVQQETQARNQAIPTEYSFKRMPNAEYQTQLSRARQLLKHIRKLSQREDVLREIATSKIHKTQLRNQIECAMQRRGINFNKNHYDCLSSYFDYNSQGEINIQELKAYLFQETDEQAMDRFERRVRLPPPVQHRTGSACNHQQAMKSLSTLKAVKMEEGSTMFARLDKNRDGYLSRGEFERGLTEMCILSQSETANLLNYFDNQNKGFLTYDEFAKKYAQSDNPNMTNTWSRMKSHSDWLNTKKSSIREQNQCKFRVPTKYSAWPKRLNESDLSLIQPIQKAAMHQGESQRFRITEKHELGQEAKQKKLSVYESKLRKLASWNEANQQRIAAKMSQEDERAQSNSYAMRLTQEAYEQRCHS